MAPNLPPWKHERIRHMLEQGHLLTSEIADDNECQAAAVDGIERNLLRFGRTTAPGYRRGRTSSIPVGICKALLTYLDGNSSMTLQEMVQYLWEKYGIRTTKSSVSRTLHAAGWTKKTPRCRAQEQDPDLVDFYLHQTSFLSSWQCLFVDESGADARDGARRTAWSPRGVTPVQVDKFHRGERYQILPAYSQNGSATPHASSNETIYLQYLTPGEADQIHQQFHDSNFSQTRQVLWTGVERGLAQQWADQRGMQTLTMAMGYLMLPEHPSCLKTKKSNDAWSRYVKGASAIFAHYAAQGQAITVLSPPPPDRFHPSGWTNL